MKKFSTSHQNTEDDERKIEHVNSGLKGAQRANLLSAAKSLTDLLGNDFRSGS